MVQDKDRQTIRLDDYDTYINVLRGMSEWWNSGPGGWPRGTWYRQNVRGLYRQARLEMAVEA